MRVEHIGDATLYLADCMDIMRDMPDKAYSLAIVDPPYGINASEMVMGKGKNKSWGNPKKWDNTPPTKTYFKELTRVSENQIIWGGNYFDLPKTGGWIFWDKERGKDVSFSDGELAWTSFLNVIKKAPIRFDGFIGADPYRIHITQKPIALYKWLLSRYAKPGDTILDTHGGSGSSVIACLDMGYSITWIEKDEDYYNAALKRIKDFAAQPKLPMNDTPEPVEQRLGFEEAL